MSRISSQIPKFSPISTAVTTDVSNPFDRKITEITFTQRAEGKHPISWRHNRSVTVEILSPERVIPDMFREEIGEEDLEPLDITVAQRFSTASSIESALKRPLTEEEKELKELVKCIRETSILSAFTLRKCMENPSIKPSREVTVSSTGEVRYSYTVQVRKPSIKQSW